MEKPSLRPAQKGSLTREQKEEMEKVHKYMELTRQEQANKEQNPEGHEGYGLTRKKEHTVTLGGKRKHKRKSRKSRRKKRKTRRKTRRKVRRRKSHKKRKYRTRRRRRKGGDVPRLGFTTEDVVKRNLTQRGNQMKRPQLRVPSPTERANAERRYEKLQHKNQIKKYNSQVNEDKGERRIQDYTILG